MIVLTIGLAVFVGIALGLLGGLPMPGTRKMITGNTPAGTMAALSVERSNTDGR
ncbi:MAG: hypothetical protein WBO08_14065 [Mycobacterium sp.]|nr:hypothetical protein [Mycobacterium sp.]